MTVNHVPHDEMDAYYANPDLLVARAKEIRSKLIAELLTRCTARFTSIFK